MVFVSSDQGGVLCGLGNWQGCRRATGVPGASVRNKGWSYTSTPLLHSACARASCCTARWRGAGAYKHKKSQAGSCPRAWWQGVCRQCWPEEGRWARAWPEMWARLDAESTLNTKRTEMGKMSWWQECYMARPSVGIDEKGVIAEDRWQEGTTKRLLQQQNIN